MNSFFTQVIRLNFKVLPQQIGHCADGTLRCKYQLALMMDEFAIMGRKEIMETVPALTRRAGLRYFLIFQGKDQVRATYPSYFVTLKTDTGERTVWGVGLEPAMQNRQLKADDQMPLKGHGTQPVVIRRLLKTGVPIRKPPAGGNGQRLRTT
jgi:hypothetical protein